MSIVEAHAPEIVDRLAIFESVCDAAGVVPGSARLDLLLRLPEGVANAIWADLGARVADEPTVEHQPTSPDRSQP